MSPTPLPIRILPPPILCPFHPPHLCFLTLLLGHWLSVLQYILSVGVAGYWEMVL